MQQTRIIGFGILKNISIYPHFSSRHVEKEVLEVVRRYPDILAICIDESTAIVFHDDQFEVIGSGTVTVLDKNRGKVVLHEGQSFVNEHRTIK